jgi:acetamidase/formamidase
MAMLAGGEGETCGVAVETAMETAVVVDLVKQMKAPWPRLEDEHYLMSVVSARPLEDAFRIAQADLLSWILEICQLDRLDAYQLLTQVSESPIAKVVDPNLRRSPSFKEIASP